MARPDVQEVNPLAVYRGGELLIAVEPGLVELRVVGVKPVPDDMPEVVERDALPPADPRDLVGEPSPPQPFGKIGEDVSRDIDVEGL
jgi:hypothetical protein